MNKIFYLIGKSASGKNALYEQLLQDPALSLKPVVMYTTRPIREGEREGITYYYRDIPFFEECRDNGKMIEYRLYHTMLGPWYYFTLDDGQIDLTSASYLMIGTLDSYEKMCLYFGERTMVPLYLEAADADRLQRALDRERRQNIPRIDEMCRRYLADEADFSEENLARLKIGRRFQNVNMDVCLREIRDYCAGVMMSGTERKAARGNR
ncbi:MAG: guanylate kinase [Butyrivibrio sp.]|nr:guanylate kinase [Acetatifactor muris]MCM1558926.1 guanylate kinase [Butyrivibrio sp.]